MFHVVYALSLLFTAVLLPFPVASSSMLSVNCDILVVGSSFSSLAAGIAAVETAVNGTTVCVLEALDAPGGQLTTGGVSALDFGDWNQFPSNNNKLLNELYEWLKTNKNPYCWVSYWPCSTPQEILDGFVWPKLHTLQARFPTTFRLYLRTVVSRVHLVNGSLGTNPNDITIQSVDAIQRFPVSVQGEWSVPLSQQLSDWYSFVSSDLFPTKQMIRFSARVIIDAGYTADVLVNTPGARYSQGFEYPHEVSLQSNAACGLSSTIVFFSKIIPFNTTQKPIVPTAKGSDTGEPWPNVTSNWYTSTDFWNSSWTYRRGMLSENGTSSYRSVNVGDISQMNWLNDEDMSYIFSNQFNNINGTQPVVPSAWSSGGVNLTALQMAEQRAMGFFWFMRKSCFDEEKKKRDNPDSNRTTSLFSCSEQFSLDPMSTGTSANYSALSKFIYFRDSRRAFGLDGFRLTHADAYYYNRSDPYVARQFNDTIALSQYLYADMHLLDNCPSPNYTSFENNQVKPNYLPLRALFVGAANGGDVTNLLVAGLTMSMTFHASAAQRLHVPEWNAGTAAGVAASIMVHSTNATLTTRELLQPENVELLRNQLRTHPAILQPLEWTRPGNLPPVPRGWACMNIGAQQRCVEVDNSIPSVATNVTQIFDSSTCASECPALGQDEWFASPLSWAPVTTRNGSVTSVTNAFPAFLVKGSSSYQVLLPKVEQEAKVENTVCEVMEQKSDHFGYFVQC